MITRVDPDLCTGCELCVDIAPNVYKMQDDTAVPISDIVPEDEQENAQDAADSCPAEAIIIEE